MARLRFYSHNRGNAILTLKGAVQEALGSELDGSALLLRSEGSRFRPRRGDVVVNYGSSNCPLTQPADGNYTVLNNAPNIATATNKRSFFRAIQAHNEANPTAHVPLPDWTESSTVAQSWVGEGSTVYSRATLQGHSGEGIGVHSSNTNPTVARANLYTKGIEGARREYRIHVFKGEVILVQKKQRRSGWRENPDYSDTVRNLDGGWVFGVSTANPSNEVRTAAINAIAACGLDFGAVDILAKGQQGRESEVYVLEVNTAPGQGGDTTTERYVAAISAVVRQETYAPYGAAVAVDMRAPEPVAAPEPAPVRVAPTPPPAPEVPVMQREELVATPAITPAQAAASAPTRASTSTVAAASRIPASLDDCVDEAFYFADVEGYREAMIVQHDSNGVFHIAGEEVPVTVTTLRSGMITLSA